MDNKGSGILVWLAAISGFALLMWKAWPAMLYFLHDLVVGTLEPDGVVDPVLPDFRTVVIGFVLIAAAQVISVWLANPKKRMFSVLRATLLLFAALLGFKVVQDVISIFQFIAMSSGADPQSMSENFQTIEPLFHGFIVVLGLSTLFGAVAATPPFANADRKALKLVESVGWIVVVLLLGWLCTFYARIDRLFEGGTDSGVDPSSLAQAFSGILNGHRVWLMVLFLVSLAAMASAFRSRGGASA